MTPTTPLIAAFTPAAQQAATAARPFADAGGDAFARQLEQMRQARERLPANAQASSLAAQSRQALLQRPAAPHAVAALQAPRPASPPPPKPAEKPAESAPHRNESRAPAARRETTPPRKDAAKSESPDGAAARPDLPKAGATAPPDAADTPGAQATPANAAPTPAPDTAPTLAWPGAAPAAGDTLPATDIAAEATQDLLAGRTRGKAATPGLNDAGLPAADPSVARTTPGPLAPSWQQVQAQATAADAVADATLARLGDEVASVAGSDAATPPAPPALGTLGALGITGATGMAGARPAEAAQVSLATPTTSAEFRSALGVQVSLLARDGIQQARLHLNPADMGPVTVQIVLDGRQAQIHFGADSAQTRQLIESGMPELASALRDAGLTLSGGGVSQHGAGRQGDESTAPGSSRRGDGSHDGSEPRADALTSAPTAQRHLRMNSAGLDLYV